MFQDLKSERAARKYLQFHVKTLQVRVNFLQVQVKSMSETFTAKNAASPPRQAFAVLTSNQTFPHLKKHLNWTKTFKFKNTNQVAALCRWRSEMILVFDVLSRLSYAFCDTVYLGFR